MNTHTIIKHAHKWTFVCIFLFILYLIVSWIFSRFHIAREALSTNTKFSYVSATNERIEFGISDLEDEAKSVCEFLKIDNQLVLIDPSASENVVMDGDYTIPRNELEIHKMYTDLIADAKLEKTMDAIYGSLFDVKTMRDKSNAQIQTMWNDINERHKYDLKLYDLIEIHTASPSSPVKPGKVTDYFLQSLQKHNTTEASLAKIRKTLYTILKPRYIQNQLTSAYLDNAVRLQNKDGENKPKSNNSLVYVLNTCAELVTVSNNTDYSTDEYLPILDTPELFSADQIRLYQTASLLIGIKEFVERIKTHENAAIRDLLKTDVPRFVAGFPKFLAKKNQLPNPSVSAYLLLHPPSI